MNDIFKRILSSIVLLILTFYCIIKGSYLFVILLITIFLISSLEWYKMSRSKPYSIYGFIYLLFSLLCVYQLRFISNDDLSFFIYVTVVCILSDVGGFVFGKILKGPKLTKKIFQICFIPVTYLILIY